METVVLLLTMCVANIACFVIGAKVGQTAFKGKDIETPNLNPVDAIRKHQVKREVEREQSRMDTIMGNIDRYDGTSLGQRDVPGR